MAIQIKGISGGLDRRGLCTLKYRYLFTGTTPQAALMAALPSTPGLPESGGRQLVEWDVDNNGFIVEAGFEGLLEEPGKEQDQYMIAREWREEPIEGFPMMDRLKEEYGAYEEDGRIKFPEYMEGKSSGGGSGLGGGATKQEKNPFFGMTSYPVGIYVATRSYVRRVVPQSVWSDVGKILQRLPGGFENQPKATWMVDNPLVRKRGNAWEIAEKWKQVDTVKHIEALQLILMKK